MPKRTEIVKLESEIRVLCVNAVSFPDGIEEAFQTLGKKMPLPDKRTRYGISRPYNGKIFYKAAAEELVDGEAESLGLERFVIGSGEYISVLIKDFMKNLPEIGNTFQKLIKRTDIDPKGYCLEWYINEKDVECMIKLKNKS